MTIVFNILIGLILVTGPIYLVFRMLSRSKKVRADLENVFHVLTEEETKKKQIVSDVEALFAGLCSLAEYEEAKQQIAAKEEQLRTERGRLHIAEAEHDALETRLREMEEVERELEASHIEAEREVEVLRSQEKELGTQKSKIKEELQAAAAELERLLEKLDVDSKAHEHVLKAKTQLAQTQEKIDWYAERVAEVNKQYLDLKRAYDALDIEYAQLYEKQNEMEAAKAKAAENNN